MYKYLYIDDERESADSYKAAVERAGRDITIDYSTPKIFDYQIQELVKNLDRYDGLILDWRLDQAAEGDGERVAFRAGALAQEIRTRGSERTEGKEAGLKELPIVLWSTRDRLNRSFHGDSTSSDLFDLIHDKDKEVIDDDARVANELASLAHGYVLVSAAIKSPLQEMVGLSDEQAVYIDQRFLRHFDSVTPISVHDLARFIFKQAVRTPGQLIDELLLAARLGVDISRSSDWPSLLDKLSGPTRYTGPFSDVWPRWWSPLVQERWWLGLFRKKHVSLSSLNAQQRVEQLKAHLQLEHLCAAEPIVAGYSSHFQTLCAISKRPLDPLDGVLIGNEPLSWQDATYISVDAALQRRHEVEGLRLHPTETERVNLLRKSRE